MYRIVDTTKRLTTRCNMIDLLNVMAEVCKSSKDIKTLNSLLDLATDNNSLEITTVTALASSLEVPRTTLSTLLTSLVKADLLRKESSKLYHFNPFIFIGKRVRSNEVREALQSKWQQ